MNKNTPSATLAETAFAIRAATPPRGHAPRRIANLLTAGAIALALDLGTAVPVKAGGKDDLAKALIAAIVIGAIVKNANKGHAAPAPAPAPKPVHKPRVPTVCAIDINTGTRGTVYPESCLRSEGFNYQLPQRCGSEARIYGRWERIYGTDCLRNAGFDVAGY